MPLEDDADFDIFDGGVKVHCFSYTPGHIIYYFEADRCDDGTPHTINMVPGYKLCKNINRCVFTGECVSIGGAAKSFEGKHQLKEIEIVMSLPDDTKLFNAHEYTNENFKFIKIVEPENLKAKGYAAKYECTL